MNLRRRDLLASAACLPATSQCAGATELPGIPARNPADGSPPMSVHPRRGNTQ
ncbi:MAG TPA: hypothetical protein VMQ99_07885 [Acetobacteraceae bacterium]|jgi:hypothetical protein|nr:hypothetical protein [Acetobacteraceae bacterium]